MAYHEVYEEQRREYQRRYYRTNSAKIKRQIKANASERRKEILDWYYLYLKQHPCVDCGERDVRVLECDHRVPSTKSYNVGAMLSGNYTAKRFRKELDKCAIRCANCHRIKTIEAAGSWRSIYIKNERLAIDSAPTIDDDWFFSD